MQVQAVNKHARKKYDEFESALNMVRIAIDDLNKYTRTHFGSTAVRTHGWQVPTKEEVTRAIGKCSNDLDVLHKQASRYKSELISRGWRV